MVHKWQEHLGLDSGRLGELVNGVPSRIMLIAREIESAVCGDDSDQNRISRDSIPLVTVALPVYNAGTYLRPAVLSIVYQTFKNWELLVIDDGSTDNAFQELDGINDVRIKLFRDGQNRGLAVRLNEAVNMAKGSYFARMDSDDISYPERFARQLAELGSDATLDLVATRAITIDENDNVTGLFPFSIRHEDICARPWQGFYLPHPTWMGRIEWFRKYRYTVPGPYYCEDQELLLRTYLTSRFGTVNEVLFGYRVKNLVDWGKLAGTRRAILGFQTRYFVNKKSWHLLFCAAIIYALKLSRDHLIKRVGRQPFCFKRDVVAVPEKLRWQKIRYELGAKDV